MIDPAVTFMKENDSCVKYFYFFSFAIVLEINFLGRCKDNEDIETVAEHIWWWRQWFIFLMDMCVFAFKFLESYDC